MSKRYDPVQDNAKREAGAAAAGLVESGMTLGLGTGSTVRWFLEELGRKIRDGELCDVWGVPTSDRTARLAREVGIPLMDLDDRGLDMAVDGADAIAPDLSVIKGYGAALLREKIVASSARRFVLVADETKIVQRLGGEGWPVPVEIEPFGYIATLKHLFHEAGEPVLRRGPEGEIAISDGGHYIADVTCPEIPDPGDLEKKLKLLPGVMETGLFCGMASLALVGGPAGVRRLNPLQIDGDAS